MNKKEFIFRGLLEEAWVHREWVLGLFTRILEAPVTGELYPYQLIHRGDEHYCLVPDDTGALQEELIEGTIAGAPIVGVKEPLTIFKGELPGVNRTIETTYGALYVNYIAVLEPFNGTLEYIEETFTPGDIERKIEPILTTTPGFEKSFLTPDSMPTPPPLSEREPGKIYVDQYIRWASIVGSVGGLCQIAVSSATPKTLLPPPGIKEYRQSLFDSFKDKELTAADVAWIESKLIEFDKEYLKDDPEAMGFYINNKAFAITRKKMFLMQGMETAFNETGGFTLIKTSLSEGVKLSDLPVQINAGRTSSFSRGSLTALGGALVKFFYRILQNTVIVDEDCGDTDGLELYIGDHPELLVEFYVIDGGKPVYIPDEAAAKPYFNKWVKVRSPHSCKAEKPNFCKICMGARNSVNPQAPSALGGEVGNGHMNTFMKAMHGSELKAVQVDLREALS